MEEAFEAFFKELIEQDPNEANSLLADAIAGDIDPDNASQLPPEIEGVTTFKEEGVLTMDKGIVLQLSNGKHVFVTIQVQ